MNIAEVLVNTAKKFSDKPAIIFQDKPLSFSELKDKVFKLANGLLDLGIKKGDKVAIYLPNWPEYILGYLAVWSIGAVVVPLDILFKYNELTSCLSHSEAKLLITRYQEGISLAKLKELAPSLEQILICHKGKTIPRIEAEGLFSFEDVIAKSPDNFPGIDIFDKDPSLIMYTSGTEGRPKGILWNYRHLDGAPKAMAYFVNLTDKDVKISALPLSHSGGLVYIQDSIYFGITLVLMERFIPLEFLKNIAKYKVTCFHIVPSMYYAILQLKDFEKFDLSSLRWVVVFGAPSAPDLLRMFHRCCPNAYFLNGWGMSETSPPNTVIPLGSDKIESIGKPAPWFEIKVFDENDKNLPPYEVGELVIRGWVVMEGYYKDPKATAEVMKDDWLHTGDLTKFDEEGYLYIVGRKKDRIKVGGQLVYAPEVEAAIYKHPKVAEVAVIGIPDKLRGEIPKAIIVPKKGESIGEDEIRYFCRKHLAHFKVPHKVEFRQSLPKTRTGKIQKEALR